MSLIEEALRKQREENEKPGNIPPPLPSPPSQPPPEPSSENSIPEVPTRRPWVLLAGIAGVGMIAILFIVWLLVFGLKLWQNKPAPPPIIKTVVVANAPAASAISQTVTRTNETTTLQPPPQPGHSATSAPPGMTTNSTLAPVQLTAPEQPAPPTSPQATLLQKTNLPPPSTTKLELPVVWPKLIVSGVIGSVKSGRSAAILNGQMLSLGDTIEGVTIDAIDKQKVKLRYRGEVKTLTVGTSTE